MNTMSSTTFVYVLESLHNVTGSQTVNTFLPSKCPCHLTVWMCTWMHAGVCVWVCGVAPRRVRDDCCCRLLDLQQLHLSNVESSIVSEYSMSDEREEWENAYWSTCFLLSEHNIIIFNYDTVFWYKLQNLQILGMYYLLCHGARCIQFLCRFTIKTLNKKITHAHFASSCVFNSLIATTSILIPLYAPPDRKEGQFHRLSVSHWQNPPIMLKYLSFCSTITDRCGCQYYRSSHVPVNHCQQWYLPSSSSNFRKVINDLVYSANIKTDFTKYFQNKG